MRFQNLISRACIIITLILAGCKDTEVAPAKTKDLIPNENLLLGNPCKATFDPVNVNNFLLQKPQYSLSYSRDRGITNWVNWHVSEDWLGSVPRQDDFRADNTLPTNWY